MQKRGQNLNPKPEVKTIKTPKSRTDKLFDIGLILKGIDAVFEVIGGLLLLSPAKLGLYLEELSQHSKHDLIARWLERLSGSVQAASTLVAVYLIIHGAAKVILIAAIFKEKKWGYIGLLVVLTIFTLIELERLVFHPLPILFLLAAFDGLLVFLIAKEYKVRYSKHPSANQA